MAVARELSFATCHEMRLDGMAKGAPRWIAAPSNYHEGLVPFRNLMFWSLAANRAAAVGATAIAAGHTRYDAESYDDAGPAFFETLAKSLRFSGLGPAGRDLAILLPLAEMSNAELAAQLVARREFLRRTWSCWRDGETPCGTCFACTERTFEAITKT